MRRICGRILLPFCLLVWALLIAVQGVAYDQNFIGRQLILLETPSIVGISEEDAQSYAAHTASYLRGATKDPNLLLTIDGSERLFLNEREVLHMQDVQQLFFWARWATLILSAALLAFCLFGARMGKLRAHLAIVVRDSLLALLAGIVAVLLVSQDFNHSFTLFHLMSFSNDLWLLDPATDLLINLLPEIFFARAALRAAVGAAIALLLLAGTAHLLTKVLIADDLCSDGD